MLQIQPDQYQALRRACGERFIARVLAHIQRHFPNHWRVVGRNDLRSLVQLGIERAAEHGYESQADVCQYVNLMLLLGADFDRDPLLPWAGQLLQQRRAERQARMNRLYDRALAFLNSSAGPSNEHLEAALRRAVAQARRGWKPPEVGDFGFILLSVLKWVFPERAAAVGNHALTAAAAEATRQAAQHGLRRQSGTFLYVGLAYMLGSGFAHDPQFSWAAKALEPRPGDGPQDQEQRLQDAALATLTNWLGD